MSFLADMLHEQSRERAWQDYVATMGWCIARTMYKDFPVPSFYDLMEDKPEDNRTAQDIKAEVLRALGV